jgi:hypothetical protein
MVPILIHADDPKDRLTASHVRVTGKLASYPARLRPDRLALDTKVFNARVIDHALNKVKDSTLDMLAQHRRGMVTDSLVLAGRDAESAASSKTATL